MPESTDESPAAVAQETDVAGEDSIPEVTRNVVSEGDNTQSYGEEAVDTESGDGKEENPLHIKQDPWLVHSFAFCFCLSGINGHSCSSGCRYLSAHDALPAKCEGKFVPDGRWFDVIYHQSATASLRHPLPHGLVGRVLYHPFEAAGSHCRCSITNPHIRLPGRQRTEQVPPSL